MDLWILRLMKPLSYILKSLFFSIYSCIEWFRRRYVFLFLDNQCVTSLLRCLCASLFNWSRTVPQQVWFSSTPQQMPPTWPKLAQHTTPLTGHPFPQPTCHSSMKCHPHCSNTTANDLAFVAICQLQAEAAVSKPTSASPTSQFQPCNCVAPSWKPSCKQFSAKWFPPLSGRYLCRLRIDLKIVLRESDCLP